METVKHFIDFECKAHDGQKGIIEGYGAVFSNIDRGGDVIEPGAFTKSLHLHDEEGTSPAMFFGHNPNEPIGEWLEVREDAKGLFMKGQLWIDGNSAGKLPIEKANQAFNMLSSKGMRGLSIGFRIPAGGAVNESGVRRIKEADLFEVSPVSIPMNPKALPTMVKGLYSHENIPSKRDLEKTLIELGLHKRAAQGLLAKGYDGLTQRDVEEPTEDKQRDVADSDADWINAVVGLKSFLTDLKGD